MISRRLLLVATASLLVSACSGGGGGGGGVNSGGSTGAAPTPTPTAVNTTLTDLRASQTFASDSVTTAVAFDLTPKTTIGGTANSDALTVSYDAGARSYTLSVAGRSQVFAPSDVTSTTTNDTVYQKTSGGNHDYLTLVKVPYTSTAATSYVGLGYWQHNLITGTRQDTQFETFTYGLATPAANVPRTGSAAFGIDVFGLAATPGFEPREFQGHGGFAIDLAAGVFSTNTYLTETGLLSGDSISGGGVQLQGSGHLSSSDGSFAGTVLYGGVNGNISGTLSGRFYGPAAEELGAAFSGSNSAGAIFTGGFTGQRDTSAPAANLTLTNLVAPQTFYTQGARLTFTDFEGAAAPQARTTTLIGQFNRQNADMFTFGPGESDLPDGAFTAADRVTSADPNFTAYQKTLSGQTVRLDLYKPGSTNTELALTYASFGRWSTTSVNGTVAEADHVYFVYGLPTTAGLLGNRTGTAHYTGIAYGAGANQHTGAQYDVKGTSLFDVNFSSQSYTGALALLGKSTNGAADTDFGTFTFGGLLSATGAQSSAPLMQNSTEVGTMTQQFYGPNGEEIGGPFTLITRDGTGAAATAIAGAAIARQH